MKRFITNSFFFKNLSILAIAFVVLSGCDKELSEMEDAKIMKKLSVQDQELINSTNRLSLDIIKSEFQNHKDENFFFSPVSVGMTLGMIYNGVGESEKNQISQAIGFESLVENEINKSYNELLSFLQVANDQMDISYANSLWFSDEVRINESYRTKVMAYYDAEISELNFKKTASFDFINSWGNLKTHGSFNKIIDRAPSVNTEIYFVNAFGLSTAWGSNNSFKSIRDFYDSKGGKLEVPTINWNGIHVKMDENDQYSFVEIPFETNTYSLSVIQPENGTDLDELIESFSIAELTNLSDNSFLVKANVSLPEMNFSDNQSFKSILSNMGLKNIFTSSADLSPSFTEVNLQISEINQNAKINLRSRAINTGNVDFTNTNISFMNINKPFLYFISETHTSTVLFAGYYSSPSAK